MKTILVQTLHINLLELNLLKLDMILMMLLKERRLQNLCTPLVTVTIDIVSIEDDNSLAGIDLASCSWWRCFCSVF